MPYDPDVDPDDFDPYDPEVLEAFLNDSGNIAMWDMSGRHFAELPPVEQIPELSDLLRDTVSRLGELAGVLAAESAPDTDARRVLLASLADHVDRATRRMV